MPERDAERSDPLGPDPAPPPSRTSSTFFIGYDPLLRSELLRLEKRSQEQTGWVLAGTLLLLVALAQLVLGGLDSRHEAVIRAIGYGLVAWFGVSAGLIRKGWYRPSFKYANVFVQVSMVTGVIYIDADMRGAAYALSSMPPFFYGLVVGITTLTISPGLCLVSGILAALQFTALYAFHLRGTLSAELLAADPIVGWEITLMKAIVLLAIGVAGMLMAVKARSLLRQVTLEVQSQEELRLVEREMAVAADVQQRLIPSEMPVHPELELESYYRPSKQVGGDYFDFLVRGDGGLIAVIGDVSGKGYPAALTMAGVQSMLRLLSEEARDPLFVIRAVDGVVRRSSVGGRFVTLAHIEIDLARDELRYVNCGHNPPVVVTRDGVTLLEDGGPVLGVLDDASYEVGTAPFPPGALLFAYTDGLTEMRGEDGAEFGAARLIDRLASWHGEPLRAVRSRLLDEVRAFLAGRSPGDDLTFLAIARRERTAPPGT